MREFDAYRRFCELATEDPDLTEELCRIASDEEEIRRRFSEELSFGTAGLRGLIGVGTARMNIYTVSRATQGVFDVINEEKRGDVPVVVVGADTRIKSDLFARRTAEVLASRGARVYLAEKPIPVPLVSFATRVLQADAGICITASHNPSSYNGYKVFGGDGSQLLEKTAARVSAAAQTHDYFEALAADGGGEILPIGKTVYDRYFDALSARTGRRLDNLSVAYTPLCGTGLEFVPRALKNAGVGELFTVPEQAKHDGAFPTCEKPNPEVPASLFLVEELAKSKGADLYFATDPDCDRIGVGVATKDGYRRLTGNESGLLLMDYFLKRAKENGTLKPSLTVCTTIVSAPMADALAADYGITLTRVLTGFKFIGDEIGRLEREGRADDFLFGFEESYGCLCSTEVRDKDACEAAVWLATMAADYKREGKTLVDALEELSVRYGVYCSELRNYEFGSPEDAERFEKKLAELRAGPPGEIASFAVVEVMDCLEGVRLLQNGKRLPLGLPKADVLSFETENGTRLTVRPSGTEPKAKVYLFAHARGEREAQETLERLVQYSDSLFA